MGRVEMDLVIPLNNKSNDKDLELKYALRSIEKNMPFVRNLVLVGWRPNWLHGDIIHIPCEDMYKNNKLKNQNILQKILIACADEKLSDNFIFTNDDIFVLQEVTELPNYFHGTLNGYITDGKSHYKPYRDAIFASERYLIERNLHTLHYDIHTPIIYNKHKFTEIFKDIKHEVVIKSIYGNTVNKNYVSLVDNKIFKHYNPEEIIEQNKDQKFLSVNDNAFDTNMKCYLDRLFPKKSKYEKPPPDYVKQ